MIENRSKDEMILFQALLSGEATKISMYLQNRYIGSIGLIDNAKDLSQFEINVELENNLFHIHLWQGALGVHYHFDEFEIETKEGVNNGR